MSAIYWLGFLIAVRKTLVCNISRSTIYISESTSTVATQIFLILSTIHCSVDAELNLHVAADRSLAFAQCGIGALEKIHC